MYCQGFDLTPSMRLNARSALKPKDNPMLKLPLSVRFDDGSTVLHSHPLVIKYPANGRTHAHLHDVLKWVCKIYRALWKVPDLEWFHAPGDALIDSFFKNPGDDVWRVGFSF